MGEGDPQVGKKGVNNEHPTMEAKVTKLIFCELDQGSFKNSQPQNAIHQIISTFLKFTMMNQLDAPPLSIKW